MLKGAIFDMDGLLIDSERMYRESWVETAKVFQVELYPEFLDKVCGSNDKMALEMTREYYPQLDAMAFLLDCAQRVWDALQRDLPPEKPGVAEILAFLQSNGVKIAIASGTEKRLIKNYMERLGHIDKFDAIISSEEVKRGKPEPDVFLFAAEKLDLKPEECYVFEDSINGVRAGSSAGCKTIMIPDTIQPDEELRSLSAGVYETLLEALEALRRDEI